MNDGFIKDIEIQELEELKASLFPLKKLYEKKYMALYGKKYYWSENGHEKRLEGQRSYYAKNREKILAKAKERYKQLHPRDPEKEMERIANLKSEKYRKQVLERMKEDLGIVDHPEELKDEKDVNEPTEELTVPEPTGDPVGIKN